MPKIIPPLLSSTPPPVVGGLDDEEEDEFGDFTTANDISYDIDAGLSVPSTPEHPSPKIAENDVNQVNGSHKSNVFEKDFQDRRKPCAKIEDFLEYTDDYLCEVEPEQVVEVSIENCFVENGRKVFAAELGYSSSPVENSYRHETNGETNCDLQMRENCQIEFSTKQNQLVGETENCEDITAANFSPSEDDVRKDRYNDAESEEFNDYSTFVSKSSPELSEVDEVKNADIPRDVIIDTDATLSCVLQDRESVKGVLEPGDDFSDFISNEIGSNVNPLESPESDPIGLDPPTFDQQVPISTTSEAEDFSEFASANCKIENDNPRITKSDDNFGEFADFEAFTAPTTVEIPSTSDDDFGDFGSFVGESKSGDLSSYFRDIGGRSEQIIKDAFRSCTSEENVIGKIEDADDNVVFGSLKDIAETKALKFQWSDSSSQKMLLKSLNIDTRNILYGPGLNLSVPKFASALCSAPLEPLKPEIVSTPSTSVNQQDTLQPEVPSAQFDWNGAGLTNPLDSASTDDKISCASLDLESQLPIEPKAESCDALSDHDDFGPFESPVALVPLRETHICNSAAKLPEDDFDDFQMSLPTARPKEPPEFQSSTVVRGDVLKPQTLEPLRPTVITRLPPKIEWPDPGITEADVSNFELNYKSPNAVEVTKPEPKADDDDWTDFVSNTEVKSPAKKSPTHNLQLSVLNLSQVRPVKLPVPVITPQGLVQTKLPSNSSIPPVWPQLQQQKVVPNFRPAIISNQYNRQFYGSVGGTNDDDDWTDFISSTPVNASRPEQSSWSGSPNIITNPGHFDSLGGRRKVAVPSISALPDLDFVTESRTFSKK